MELSAVVEKAQKLSDIELAILLCLMASQHCIIRTHRDSLVSLSQEVQLVSSTIFGLSHTVIRCDESITLDDFRAGLLIEGKPDEQDLDVQGHGAGLQSAKKSRLDRSPIMLSPGGTQHLDSRESERHDQRIANIVVLEGLSLASDDVQIQALELLRTRRIFTHTAVHSAPKMFVIVVLNSDTDPRLVNHLNDHLFVSHHHESQDGFPNLEEASKWVEDDQTSLASVAHRSNADGPPLLQLNEIRMLVNASNNVTTTAEITAYVHNVIIFLRLHRAVAGGVSPKATRMLKILINCLATLHGLTFATPAMALLAARKIYPHRIVLGTPSNDRSLQYGSDIQGLKGFYEGLKSEDVIEQVLEQVEIPV